MGHKTSKATSQLAKRTKHHTTPYGAVPLHPLSFGLRHPRPHVQQPQTPPTSCRCSTLQRSQRGRATHALAGPQQRAESLLTVEFCPHGHSREKRMREGVIQPLAAAEKQKA